MTEGITHADMVTTVSPTYLKEIQTEELGAGLDDLVRDNLFKTQAILNGIDYSLHDPSTNASLAIRYDLQSDLEKVKQVNKTYLQKTFGLPIKRDVTVIGFVGRLDVNQKGIDVLHRMISREEFDKCQFVIMGHGKESWEERFGTLATFLPDTVSVMTKYDDELASLIYAGSDFVLIPSHFEPCCLIQMYAMRYGAIPIARATGGLNDTIKDRVNGFLYTSPTARVLKQTITKALEIKKMKPEIFEKMIRAAMATNFSWNKSAQEYIALYRQLVNM
jgi:starch synthase